MPDQNVLSALKKTVFALALLILSFVSGTAQACSFKHKSLYDYYTESSRVFVGTVEEGPDSAGSYKVSVSEAFKGFDDTNEFKGTVDVVFDAGQCGFDQQKKGARLLIFMNAGQEVSPLNGTTPIWDVEDQTKVETNLYKLILLRNMLDPDYKGIPKGAVPDEETAIYMAFKAMIPVYGKEMVSRHVPYKAALIREKQAGSDYEEDVWHIVGTSECDSQRDSCENVAPKVKIHKWSGKILNVYTGG